MTGVYFLNYASCKWSPNLRREINEVELVQRRFMKKIRNLRDLTYGRRLNRLSQYDLLNHI